MTNSLPPPQVVTPVVWNKPDSQYSVPMWIIILAILAGLLLLALVIYVLYKVSGQDGADVNIRQSGQFPSLKNVPYLPL